MSEIFSYIGIDPGIPVILCVILVIALAFVTVSSRMRLIRLEKRYKVFMKGADGVSLEKSFARRLAQIDKLFVDGEVHQKELAMVKTNFEHLFSKFGIEKYDAFDDVGGKMSFALAMLDRDNSGFILNAIHSRDNCFLYLKEIVKGESYVMLSKEEVEALRKAVNYGMPVEKKKAE